MCNHVAAHFFNLFSLYCALSLAFVYLGWLDADYREAAQKVEEFIKTYKEQNISKMLSYNHIGFTIGENVNIWDSNLTIWTNAKRNGFLFLPFLSLSFGWIFHFKL